MIRPGWTLPYWLLSFSIAAFSLAMVGVATGLSLAEVMPHLAHYAPTLELPLYAHIIFGPLALLLAPFQFQQGLRARHPRVHRTIGYSYAVSVLLAGVAALALLSGFQGTAWAAAGFLILDAGWLGATGYAVYLARRRDFVRHRRWMMRSAALTFAAVALRLIMIPMVISGMTVTQTYDVTAWLSWLLPLAFVEWRLRMFPNPPVRSRT